MCPRTRMRKNSIPGWPPLRRASPMKITEKTRITQFPITSFPARPPQMACRIVGCHADSRHEPSPSVQDGIGKMQFAGTGPFIPSVHIGERFFQSPRPDDHTTAQTLHSHCRGGGWSEPRPKLLRGANRKDAFTLMAAIDWVADPGTSRFQRFFLRTVVAIRKTRLQSHSQHHKERN